MEDRKLLQRKIDLHDKMDEKDNLQHRLDRIKAGGKFSALLELQSEHGRRSAKRFFLNQAEVELVLTNRIEKISEKILQEEQEIKEAEKQ